MRTTSLTSALTLMWGCLAMATASADPILSNGLYALNNRAAGGSQPSHGFSIEGLDGFSDHQFTFDFDHAAAGMFMDLDLAAGTIRVFGTAFGGLIDSSNTASASQSAYAESGDFVGLWGIDFTYSAGVARRPGGDGIVVFGSGGPESPNAGTLTRFADSGLGVAETR